MGEPSRLSTPSINRHTDVGDVLDFSEKLIKFLIGHIKRHVSNEQGISWRLGFFSVRWDCFGVGDDNAPAFELFEVVHLDSVGGGLFGPETHVAEAREVMSVHLSCIV